MDKERIRSHFPVFNEIELLEELAENGIEKTFKRGENIIRKGEYMKYMPLIISGSIKVLREDDQGHEVLLYFLEVGNTCAMSITCCLKQEKSEIRAIAEDDTKVLMIPVWVADGWIKNYSSWKNFIMNSYAARLQELLFTLESIAFYSLDERLLKYLRDRSNTLNKNEFEITHGKIATELNSSREAISRLLKKLEKMGKVKLGRNKIKILAL